MQEKIALFLSLGIFSGLTFGVISNKIQPEIARDIAYSTTVVVKSILK